MVEFVFFDLIGILNNLQTFLRQESERARDEADGIVGIVAVSRELLTWWRVGISLLTE